MKETDIIDIETIEDEMENTSKSGIEFLDLITEHNVFSYIENTQMGQMLSLPIDQMRSAVKSWKVRQKTSILKL